MTGAQAKRDSNKPKAAFDMDEFSKVFKQPEHKTAITGCYERALKRDPKLKGGRMTVTVSVGETGTVQKVQVAAPADFGLASDCIRDAVKRWRFQSTGEEYAAEFPLILQAGGT